VSKPVFGGTLLADPTRALVYASDPEGDRVLSLDVANERIRWEVALPAGSTPFRLAASDHALFVTLREGSSIARIDLTTLASNVLPSCVEPRGVAWDGDGLWVACASGELEHRDGEGNLLSSTWIATDLRDVVPTDGVLLVSRLRTAEVLTVDPTTLAVVDRRRPVDGNLTVNGTPTTFTPQVGWRLVATPDGLGAMLLHQRSSNAVIALSSDPDVDSDGGGAYGSDVDANGLSCGLVQVALTWFPAVGAPVSGQSLFGAPVAVDTQWIPSFPGWAVVRAATETSEVDAIADEAVVGLTPDPRNAPALDTCVQMQGSFPNSLSSVVAVADLDGTFVTQGQSPFSLAINGKKVDLGDASADPIEKDVATGFSAFHRVTESQLACASCHPEGSDDGHIWNFGWDGVRRTLDLRGGIASTAPFHWDGALANFPDLLEDVMVGRMGGPESLLDDADPILGWIDGLPAQRPAPGDEAAIARGDELFHSAALACSTCHAGEQLTSPASVAVGTGMVLQPPSLVGVGSRGPWMHDGCAQTLADRFLDDACGGGAAHGAKVAAADVPDLVAYLDSL
jgi:hypothetical protein